MPTNEAIQNMREWLTLTQADARWAPADLREISRQAPGVAARELDSDAPDEAAAWLILTRNPAVREAVEAFQTANEALAMYREQPQQNNDEDRRLDRKRITAREDLVAAVGKATGRSIPDTP